MNRVLLKNMKALLQARSKDVRDWVPMVPVVQGCANKTLKVQSRGDKTPMELLTGLQPKTGLDSVAWLGVEATVGTVTHAQLMANFADLHKHMEGLWETAVEAQQKRRVQNAKAKAGRAKALPRICVGDYVLVAMPKPRTKLQMTWTGPHQVLGPRADTPFVWLVEPLGAPPGTKPIQAHVVRIRRFSNAALATDADAKQLLASARKDFPLDFIQKIIGHRKDDKTATFLLKVRWVGWGSTGDTWEPIHTLAEDDPHRVEEYLTAHRADDDCGRYLAEYFGQQ